MEGWENQGIKRLIRGVASKEQKNWKRNESRFHIIFMSPVSLTRVLSVYMKANTMPNKMPPQSSTNNGLETH